MNRVWMITGAGRGLGHAFAEEAVIQIGFVEEKDTDGTEKNKG